MPGIVQRRGIVPSVSGIVNCAVVMLMCLFLAAPGAYASSLTPGEQLGKRIFFEGVDAEGKEVMALFGKEQLKLSGRSAACATCHGYDGLGRSESGVVATRITWSTLMKSYPHLHADGLEHPPFSEETLKSYLVSGLFPGGIKGNPDMPRYSLSPDSLATVITYLKRLETDLDPGLSDATIRIGTVIPSEGSLGEMGELMSRTIRAYFAEINVRGGIYGRKLELVTVRRGSATASRESLHSLLREKNLFALVSTFTPGRDSEIAAMAEEGNIPLIGPFTMFPLESVELNRHSFFILSGLREQVRALVDFAEQLNIEKPRVALVSPAGKELAGTVDAAVDACKSKGWEDVLRSEYTSGSLDAGKLVGQLKSDGRNLLVFLADETEAVAFLKQAEKERWTPPVLTPGLFWGKGINDVPPGFKSKLYFAYPTLPDDRKEWGALELAGLMKRHNLPAEHVSAQQSAYVAAKLLVEGLRRSGRELSRERLLTALENMYEYDTGLTPPITYDRNRRIGAMGAYIVTIDPAKESGAFISSKQWVPTH